MAALPLWPRMPQTWHSSCRSAPLFAPVAPNAAAQHPWHFSGPWDSMATAQVAFATTSGGLCTPWMAKGGFPARIITHSVMRPFKDEMLQVP